MTTKAAWGVREGGAMRALLLLLVWWQTKVQKTQLRPLFAFVTPADGIVINITSERQQRRRNNRKQQQQQQQQQVQNIYNHEI